MHNKSLIRFNLMVFFNKNAINKVNKAVTAQNVFMISLRVCGRGLGWSASLQILAIAKLLLWFVPRPHPNRIPHLHSRS